MGIETVGEIAVVSRKVWDWMVYGIVGEKQCGVVRFLSFEAAV
jgi:hypothetical protein